MVNSYLFSTALCFSTTVNAVVLRRESCSFSARADEFDDTQSMAEFWAIDEFEFVRHNPGVKLGEALERQKLLC